MPFRQFDSTSSRRSFSFIEGMRFVAFLCEVTKIDSSYRWSRFYWIDFSKRTPRPPRSRALNRIGFSRSFPAFSARQSVVASCTSPQNLMLIAPSSVPQILSRLMSEALLLSSKLPELLASPSCNAQLMKSMAQSTFPNKPTNHKNSAPHPPTQPAKPVPISLSTPPIAHMDKMSSLLDAPILTDLAKTPKNSFLK